MRDRKTQEEYKNAKSIGVGRFLYIPGSLRFFDFLSSLSAIILFVMAQLKELRIPFTWENRQPVLLDRFFYVPPVYDRHEEFPPISWSDMKIFGNDREVMLEYCSGNGQWICEKAKQYPDYNWVALDLRFDRSKKTWGRLHREKITNLYVICGDAAILTKHYLPKNSLKEVFMNFPDPWPKLRHAKHRLVQRPFIEEMERLLVEGGKATFVTDDAPYANQMLAVFSELSSWRPLMVPPHYELNPKNYGDSFFSDLWMKKGRNIYFLPFQKVL